MLYFLIAVQAVFLIENNTNKFLSVSYPQISLVEYDLASDFKIHRGALKHLNITLEDPIKKVSLDQKFNTDLMVGYKTKKDNNQSYRLVLIPNSEFTLVHNYKCLKLNPLTKEFLKRQCNEELTTFTIAYEVSVKPEANETNASNDFKIFIKKEKQTQHPVGLKHCHIDHLEEFKTSFSEDDCEICRRLKKKIYNSSTASSEENCEICKLLRKNHSLSYKSLGTAVTRNSFTTRRYSKLN